MCLCALFADNNYSTLNERDHSRTLDRSGDLGDMEPLKGTPLMVNPLYIPLPVQGWLYSEACRLYGVGKHRRTTDPFSGGGLWERVRIRIVIGFCTGQAGRRKPVKGLLTGLTLTALLSAFTVLYPSCPFTWLV